MANKRLSWICNLEFPDQTKDKETGEIYINKSARNYSHITEQLGVFYDEASDAVMFPEDFDKWRRPWSEKNAPGTLHDNDLHELVDVCLKAETFKSGLCNFDSISKFQEAFIRAALNNQRNLQKELITAAKWDGVERLATMLIDLLGAEDTPYVREVTMMTVVAMIARVWNPGIKFDTMLVLVGPQGIGKSSLFSKLGSHLYCDSVTMKDMEDCKKVCEKAGPSLLLEFAEMNGLNKTEIEGVKSFLTSTHDAYRPAYAKNAVKKPRTFICVGTANNDKNEGFLRDLTGNRRFLIVPCHKEKIKMSVFSVDSTYWQQIRAEAYAIYLSGKQSLYLNDTAILKEAERLQRSYLETSDELSKVEEYLDLALPSDFYEREICDLSSSKEWHVLSAPRVQLIQQLLNSSTHIAEPGMIIRNIITNREIYRECLGGDLSKFNQVSSKKITAIMMKLGWDRVDSEKRIGGEKFHFYWRRPGTDTDYSEVTTSISDSSLSNNEWSLDGL